MKQRMSNEIWQQIKVAHAAGIGLREAARNMNVPEGTVLSRAKREGLTLQIARAKLIERPELARELAKPDAINAITPMQSVAITMQQRADRYVECIADVTDKVLPHLKKMEPDEILDGIDGIEKYDRMTRRNYGLGDGQQRGG